MKNLPLTYEPLALLEARFFSLYEKIKTQQKIIEEHQKILEFLTKNYNTSETILDIRKKDKEKLIKEIEKLNSCNLTEDECGALDANFWDVLKIIKKHYS